MQILLVATMRNEGPHLVEWVAYHLSIGFTHLVVCTNDCIDGSPALLDRLAEIAPVTHVRTRVGPADKAQLAAYRAAEALPAVRTADWAMVLDGDEFLNIHVGAGTVPELIAAAPRATAFLVNWRLFGSAGHDDWDGGATPERFTRAAPREHGVNRPFKTLFTRLDAYGCVFLPHQPRFPDPARIPDLLYVNGGGAELPRWFIDESRGDFLQSEPGTVSWALAQVNHYNTRSRDDYLVKHDRGGGLDIAWDRDASWAVFDRNEEVDTSILARLPRAHAIRDGLLADPALRRRHEECRERYGAHVAALKQAAEPTRAVA